MAQAPRTVGLSEDGGSGAGAESAERVSCGFQPRCTLESREELRHTHTHSRDLGPTPGILIESIWAQPVPRGSGVRPG